jgi:type I restriction enzyme S subunit
MKLPVSEIFEFVRNGLSVKHEKDSGGLPITRIETIADATINLERVGFAGISLVDAKQYLLQDGDILFSHINSVSHLGKCAMYNEEFGSLVHGMNLLCFRANREKLHPKFALYLIRSNQFKNQLAKSIKKSVNQASVSTGDIKKIVLNIPPLAEQQRIAELLDTAEHILMLRKSAIAKIDQLSQSLFVDMFSDHTKYECEEVVLGDCLRFTNGRAYSQNELLDTGTPVIRIQNLNGGNRWYYSNLSLPENKYCYYGDLLFAWSGSFGPYIWSGKKSIYHYHIWKIETTKKIDKTFAYYLLLSITQKIRDASHGASMLHMTKGGMEAWKIKLPSLAYQMKFVEFIYQLHPIEAAYKKSIQLMTDNIRSLQHQSLAVN